MNPAPRRHVNLLPVEVVRKRLIHRATRTWGAVGLVAALALVSDGVWNLELERQAVAKRNILQKQVERGQSAAKELAQLREDRKRFDSETHSTIRIASERSMTPLLGVIGKAASKGNGNIFVDSMQFDRGQLSPGGNTSRRTNRKLTLTGIGEDNVAISRFASELRSQEMFASVDLESTGKANRRLPEGQSGRSFKVVCFVYAAQMGEIQ